MRAWRMFRMAHGVSMAGLALVLTACGGGGGAAPTASSGSNNGTTTTVSSPVTAASNVLALRVDSGTDGSAFNVPFVTVTVCQPGGTVCTDVSNVLVDTGSQGLRISASALPTGFTLPAVTTPAGNLVGQCGQFASGYTWGSVRQATVKLGGITTTSAIPVQVIGDAATAFASIPGSCAATGGNLGAGLGARGILGVGLLDQDCGTACVSSVAPAVYFACNAAGGCNSTTLALASQVRNPVAALPAGYDNGVIVQLPAVPAGGARSADGALILGVGTQSNNLPGTNVVRANSLGRATTLYRGASYSDSFLDSGSNGLFFNDGSINRCGDFYCPSNTLTVTGQLSGVGGTVRTASVDIVSITSVTGAAAASVAGPIGNNVTFIWGLPFFYGRSVATVRSGSSSSAGTGPLWAW